MASRKNKKEKVKLLKSKQKEIRIKNKENTENKENKVDVLDFDEITAFSGTKGYVLVKLSKIIENLQNDKNSDSEILSIARDLSKFSINTQTLYNEFLNKNKKKLSKTKLNMINRGKYNLNTTERALLKARMEGIMMEYLTKDPSVQRIDYGAIRISFETVYKLLMLGLKEKKIKSIDIYVGYGDVLCDVEVVYEDNDEKYNLNDNIFMYAKWNILDDLYNTYTIYKTNYINFSENSLQSLATATIAAKEYESRTEGKELVSYNGVVLNYVGALESELKKLISKKFNLNIKKLKFVDAINYLNRCNNDFLSNKTTIDNLHKVRLLRNKVAHGDSITYEEFKYIQNFLLNTQILEFISWDM